MKKILLTSILVGTMVLSSVGASAVEQIGNNYNGWNYRASTNVWEYYINSEKPINGVIQQGNKLYYFNSEGNLENGWYHKNDVSAYFKDGLMVKGWKLIDNVWYYFGDTGIMATGTQTIDNKVYNFDSNGHLL